ncbi:MAG: Gfo/Idh/MocA family protein, partial [Flavisolibacter sp.]
NPDIDIIYIVLPNALHANYVERAARAGKHVICEKPMAITVDECDRMISACETAGIKLSIGYRLHFEPHNLEMIRIGQENSLGNIQKIKAEHGMEDTEGWRINAALSGGGPLMDVGIYCVQACRYVTGLEPISVTARELPKSKPEKFKEVEEALSWEMEFPGGLIAYCKSSYSEVQNILRIEAEKGWAELKPAYKYRGIKGAGSQGKMDFPQVNQQARQMDDFALAIKNDRASPVPGDMGRQDVRILQAIYKSMRSGETIMLD